MGGGSNPVKKVVKAVTGAAKKIVKPITKAVSKVAKAVVKVGKKVVKGVKKGLKSVGKAFSKLGPLASLALMAIPGFQPFAAGLASSMGFTSQLATNMMSGALTGFITSGGDLKAGLMGGAMAGLGSVASGVGKGIMSGQGFGEAMSSTMSNLGAANQFGVTDLASGITKASDQWGSFTDKVGEFFSSNSATGSISEGASNSIQAANTAASTGGSYNEALDALKATEATTAAAGPAPTPYSQPVALEPAPTFEIPKTQMQTLMEQQQAFGTAADADLFEALKGGTPTYMQPLEIPIPGMSETDASNWRATVESMGIDPTSQQAKMLAEQQYGGSVDMTKTASGDWNYASYDSDLALGDLESLKMTAVSGGGSPEYVAANYKPSYSFDPSKFAKALATSSSAEQTKIPFVTSVSPIDMMKAEASGTAGTAGLTGFTDVQRQTQASLLANIEQQQALARQRAAGGWGLV